MNDIKKGTSDIWLIAFRALFEVSLVFMSSRDASQIWTESVDVRQAPENSDHIVREFVDQLLSVLWRVLGRGQELRERGRDLAVGSFSRVRRYIYHFVCYLWNESFQWS